MAHLAARSGYREFVERLNRFPQGAPPSELLSAILALLFTPREAAPDSYDALSPCRGAAAGGPPAR